jgi:hypothetical protein
MVRACRSSSCTMIESIWEAFRLCFSRAFGCEYWRYQRLRVKTSIAKAKAGVWEQLL